MQDKHQDWSEEDGELTSLLLGAGFRARFPDHPAGAGAAGRHRQQPDDRPARRLDAGCESGLKPDCQGTPAGVARHSTLAAEVIVAMAAGFSGRRPSAQAGVCRHLVPEASAGRSPQPSRPDCLRLRFVSLVAASFADAAWLRQQRAAAHLRMGQLVVQLQLTDLCLFTEARYTRHLSQADLHSAFQDHPLGLEHFPTGSLVVAAHPSDCHA
jgi:hypothetical protein